MTDPSGSGLIADQRYVGQEGAGAAPGCTRTFGALGVTGFLMKDPAANPLDYVEGGPLNARRQELSEWLDSTNPDLSAFERRGGRMIVTIGTDDTLASPGCAAGPTRPFSIAWAAKRSIASPGCS